MLISLHVGLLDSRSFAGTSVSLHSDQVESSESLSLESGSVDGQLVNASVGVDVSDSNDKSLDDKESIISKFSTALAHVRAYGTRMSIDPRAIFLRLRRQEKAGEKVSLVPPAFFATRVSGVRRGYTST